MLAKSGEVEIANITFKGVKEGSYNLTIGRIKILDLDTGQEITLTLEEAEIIVVAPKEKPICTDSDNGIDFNVKGTVNGYLTTEKKEIGTLSDTCVAAATGNEEDTHKELLRSKVVHELSCSPEDVISHSWHHCGETRECVEGKCVPIKSEPYCGNGVIDAGETCDDGNAVDEDGCSATCTVEEGWTCSGVPSRCCFDSDGGYNLSVWGWAIGVNEAANLFGTYNDSCSNEGKILERTCTSDSKVKINSQDCPSGTHCKDGACVAGAVCGNSILETGEQCDNTTFTVENCTSKGFKGGTPTCTNCIVNYSSCTRHTVGETCTLFTLGALASTCADGLTCEKNNIGALVCTSSIPPVAIVKPIDIKLTPVGSLIATTSVGKGKEYDITVTLAFN
ncbi:hypothetical protein HZC30_02675 [Candidatus Woesearchaeota archaeon]|nr:hypothetical protein [Candidatus Woesearchaeota archaeon]